MNKDYYIDNVNLKEYGVYVSDSIGLISTPKLKEPVKNEWQQYHGQSLWLNEKYFEAREIRLECFIVATDATDFIYKSNAFIEVLNKPFTRRLSVVIGNNEPLVYEVYQEQVFDIKKTWKEGKMIGTFTLNFKEPEPIKKVYKYQRTSTSDKTVSITLTSTKMLNIYWGDGLHTFDCSGTSQTYTHDYSVNGYFYIVITGNIDEISSISSTGTLVWNKL